MCKAELSYDRCADHGSGEEVAKTRAVGEKAVITIKKEPVQAKGQNVIRSTREVEI